MTTATMRAISQDVLGGTEVLKEVELDRPEPGLSEILVRVHAGVKGSLTYQLYGALSVAGERSGQTLAPSALRAASSGVDGSRRHPGTHVTGRRCAGGYYQFR